MDHFTLETEKLREKVRAFKEQSCLSYKAIAGKLSIPYASFRNFMYGCNISEERYEKINTTIDEMFARLPW